MSFVPVTGRATFRAADPPREGVVEFSDERRTVALPIRAALPVLTRAHQRDDAHPTVGLLAGAVLLAMRMVAAGKIEPDQRAGWQIAELDTDDQDRLERLVEARAPEAVPTVAVRPSDPGTAPSPAPVALVAPSPLDTGIEGPAARDLTARMERETS